MRWITINTNGKSWRKSILTLSIAEFYEYLTEAEYNEMLEIIGKAGKRKNKANAEMYK